MEYIYSAMLLNSAGAEIDAKSVTKVLKAAGLKTDKARAEARSSCPGSRCSSGRVW